MALIVSLNLTVSGSNTIGTYQDPNASYWDPLTGTNLFRGSPLSGNLASFSAAQLVNISNAVYSGRLALVSGTAVTSATGTWSAGMLPYHTDSANNYALFAQHNTIAVSGETFAGSGTLYNTSLAGVSGGGFGWQGITSVAAGDLLENNYS
jgi:hypothetical protein